mgnify:FL=1
MLELNVTESYEKTIHSYFISSHKLKLVYKSIFIVTLFFQTIVFGQHTFTTILKDSAAHELLSGATAKLKNTGMGAVADKNGVISIENIPNGQQTIVISCIGFETLDLSLHFPLKQDIPFIYLEPVNK